MESSKQRNADSGAKDGPRRIAHQAATKPALSEAVKRPASEEAVNARRSSSGQKGPASSTQDPGNSNLHEGPSASVREDGEAHKGWGCDSKGEAPRGPRYSQHAATSSANSRSAAGHKPHTRRKQLCDTWKVAAWSKAGVSTVVLIRDRISKRSILLDCGGCGGVSPALMAEADVVLVSHTHADHCAGLFAHARSRFANARPAQYFVPVGSLEAVTQARAAFEAMDGKPLNMDIVEVAAGDEINLGRGLSVECVATEHRVPSVGFLLYRQERKMKEEFISLTGEQKGEIGRSGVSLYETTKTLEVSYSGDTTANGLDPRIFQAKLAIVECTFLEEKERRLAEVSQHVLLSDLQQRIESCGANPECQLLLMHFSARYSSSQITHAVRQARLLPKKTACALSAFHSEFHTIEDDVGVFLA